MEVDEDLREFKDQQQSAVGQLDGQVKELTEALDRMRTNIVDVQKEVHTKADGTELSAVNAV